MFDIKKIIEAWIIAGNPTDIQMHIAEERANVCSKCEYKKVYIEKLKIGAVCTACGCPIAKKIFTNSFNACSLQKWEEVDKNHFPEQKNNKTLF